MSRNIVTDLPASREERASSNRSDHDEKTHELFRIKKRFLECWGDKIPDWDDKIPMKVRLQLMDYCIDFRLREISRGLRRDGKRSTTRGLSLP